MTAITIEVPDELAAKLATLGKEMPDLIAQALERQIARASSEPEAAKASHLAFLETLDFLTSGPTVKQIIEFKASPKVQDRLEELLDKNREERLTEDEESELDAFEQINDLMILLKAHARAHRSQAD